MFQVQEDFSKYNGEGTTLRRAQMRMLEILEAVDAICRRHRIDYWLDGGTCLGAVRHGGFIPWDDDLDITVQRRDFRRLCRILKKELPEGMVYQDWKTDKYYPNRWAKVRDRHSYLRDPNWNPKVKEQGIYIDIFPVERGVPEVKAFVERTYGRAFRCLHHMGSRKNYFVAALVWPVACAIVWLLRVFRFVFPKDALIYAYGMSTAGRYRLDRRDFLSVRPIRFEGREFSGPANPDGYLRRVFGDYMQIPPPEKRQVHATEIVFYDQKNL